MFVFVFKSRLSNARNMLTFSDRSSPSSREVVGGFCPALGTLPKQLPFCLILPVLRKFEFDFMDVFLCQDFISFSFVDHLFMNEFTREQSLTY